MVGKCRCDGNRCRLGDECCAIRPLGRRFVKSQGVCCGCTGGIGHAKPDNNLFRRKDKERQKAEKERQAEKPLQLLISDLLKIRRTRRLAQEAEKEQEAEKALQVALNKQEAEPEDKKAVHMELQATRGKNKRGKASENKEEAAAKQEAEPDDKKVHMELTSPLKRQRRKGHRPQCQRAEAEGTSPLKRQRRSEEEALEPWPWWRGVRWTEAWPLTL